MPADPFGFAQHLPDKPSEGDVGLVTVMVVAHEPQPVGPGDAPGISRVVEGGQVLHLPAGAHPPPPVNAVQIGDVYDPVGLRVFLYQQVTEVQIPVVEPQAMHAADQRGEVLEQLPLAVYLKAGEGRGHLPLQVVIQALRPRKFPG